MGHIELARWAHAGLIAPPVLLSGPGWLPAMQMTCSALYCLATEAPIAVAPGDECVMWPIGQRREFTTLRQP